jgi:hypothetical protein
VSLLDLAGVDRVLSLLRSERITQNLKWGEQNHPNGTGGEDRIREATWAREYCQRASDFGTVTWADIFEEEAFEALAESDPERLRAELLQVAAVAVAWVEAIDRGRSA